MEEKLIEDEMRGRIVAVAAEIAMRDGADEVTVRRIIRSLGVTNRVFYNRFHNVEEVLDVVYREMALKMRESLAAGFDPEGDFFEQMTDMAAATLRLSYRLKRGMNPYVFMQDSTTPENFAWWRAEIKKLIELGVRRGLVRDVDADAMSYAVWCFIRGYNADALARGLPEDEATRGFRYSFGVLLDGMRA